MRDLNVTANWSRWSALLLLVALLRMASVVLADPAVGYANQYDMHRSSACIGLWPDAVPVAQATPDAPQPVYRLQPAQPAACYPSTQVAVAWLAVSADRLLDRLRNSDAERVSIRAVGVMGLLLWALGAVLVAWMLWSQPRCLFAHGLISALIIADPLNTLYLNTLYTEFPALCSAYFAGAIVVSLWLDPASARRRLLALSLCLVLLGLSRVQHLLLPLVLAVLALLAVWRAGGALLRPALLLAACCVLVVGVQVAQQSRFASIGRANVADTVLGAAMPAGEPERIAADLGLDAACADLAYSTWYRQHGVDIFAECPQLASVSRIRLLLASVRDPGVLARMLLRGLLMSQNVRLGYLGERAGSAFAAVDGDDSPLWSSIAAPIAALPASAFLWWMTALCGLVPVFWLTLLWWAMVVRRRDALTMLQADTLSLVVCAHVLLLTLLSSVFGDGYSEVARHLHLGLNAGLVAAVLLPVWILRRASPAALRGLAAAGVRLPAATLLFWLALTSWATQRLPLAFGVLDAPVAMVPMTGMLELRGWALDVRRIERVVARVDGRELQAMTRVAHPSLQRVFPYLPGALRGGFVGSVDAALLAGGRFLEIVAIDAHGREVIIERRRIRAAAYSKPLANTASTP